MFEHFLNYPLPQTILSVYSLTTLMVTFIDLPPNGRSGCLCTPCFHLRKENAPPSSPDKLSQKYSIFKNKKGFGNYVRFSSDLWKPHPSILNRSKMGKFFRQMAFSGMQKLATHHYLWYMRDTISA